MTKEVKRLIERGKRIPHGAVKVPARPKCDFCEQQALVDGKTVFGPWANLCYAHFKTYGVGLGLGRGQVLLTDEEN